MTVRNPDGTGVPEATGQDLVSPDARPPEVLVRPARIEARGFSWRHAGRKDPALSGLDLVIEPGEKVLIAGASGSGKSTLLHALVGLLDDEAGHRGGELLVDGAPPDPRSGRAGLVLQDPDAQAVLSRLGDDIAFGLENQRWPVERIWPRVRQVKDLVGLGQQLDHPTEALSGGQKQRLALAGVLAYAPGLVVLDEPTANIDPVGVPRLRDAVLDSCRETGATLVLVEHRIGAWAEHMDRLIVLGPDGVLADGSPEGVLQDAGLRPVLDAAGVWYPGRSSAVLVEADGMPGTPAGAGKCQEGTAAPEVLLEAEDLAVARTLHGPPAATGISLRLRAGHAVALIGANGSGKSTAALTLAGFLPPRGGTVRAHPALLRHRAVQPPRGRKARRRRDSPDPAQWPAVDLVARIGYVFQEPEHQFLATTVRDELALGLRRTGAGHEAETVDRLLEELRLTRLAQAHPLTLSGGEKRRLSVACMLATSPPVLVLDEPTFGQDARTWDALIGLIRARLEEGCAVLTVSHDHAFARALGAEALSLGVEGKERRR